MPEETQAQNQEAQAENKPAASSAATQNTEQQPQEQTVPYSRFKEVNDRLKAIEQEAAARAAAQAAEDEKKLAQQQEWQKLYEARKAKVDELTPKAELADKLSEMVLAQYEAEIKDWPEQVRGMAPSDDASILAKLDWMNKAKPLAVELMADKTPTPGNGPRPTPVAAGGAGKAADAERQQWRQQAARRYR